jgi:hypothetical protein
VILRLAAVASLLALTAPALRAGTIDVVAGDATWHPWQTPSTAQVANSGWGPAQNIVPGTAFWNNWSIDGVPNHQCNVGFWLSGTGGCTAVNSTSHSNSFLADSPSTTASYLGSSNTFFTLTPSSGAAVQVTMHVQVSTFSAAGTNQFGWFDTSAPGTLFPIFGGTTASPSQVARGTVATFIPSGAYGFYLSSPTGTYLTSGAGDTQTHFAVFQLSGTSHYMFGLEELNNGWLADWDYNDLTIEIQEIPNPVPEPGTMVLFGAGMVCLLAVSRRRRR